MSWSGVRLGRGLWPIRSVGLAHLQLSGRRARDPYDSASITLANDVHNMQFVDDNNQTSFNVGLVLREFIQRNY